MKNIYDELMDLMNDINLSEQIELSDIPSLDLYMDQVTTLFDNKLQSFKRVREDKILTKTMINNYAKAKLLLTVKGKKYSKEQMVLLALIYNLKQTLSINDTGLVLEPIIKKLSQNDSTFSLDNLYNNFLDLNKLQNEAFERWFGEKITFIQEKYKDTPSDDEEHLILTVLMLISSANIQKRMAEKIIDTFLTPKIKNPKTDK